mmetsp:Transcript_78020/g.200900  ORF Transcript_78020/g.200900 Transcript_78020/m.200900 type:complete len:267 (+) Transcript_78020:248-1048(+)
MWHSTDFSRLSSSMPSSAMDRGGAEWLPLTAGTLLRPLGSAPPSRSAKPMRSRSSSSSSSVLPAWHLNATARDGVVVTARSTSGTSGDARAATSSLMRCASGCSSQTSSASSSSSLGKRGGTLKAPRRITSKRRAGARAGALRDAESRTGGASCASSVSKSGVGVPRSPPSAGGVGLNDTLAAAAGALLPAAGRGMPAHSAVAPLRHCRCHWLRVKPLESVDTASVTLGGASEAPSGRRRTAPPQPDERLPRCWALLGRWLRCRWT